MTERPTDFHEIEAQPEQVTIAQGGGLFIKRTHVLLPNTALPQHSHAYDHLSMISAGGVKVWTDDEFLGEFKAPQIVLIKANTKHLFVTTAAGTIIDCIHRVDDAGEPEISEHNHMF